MTAREILVASATTKIQCIAIGAILSGVALVVAAVILALLGRGMTR